MNILILSWRGPKHPRAGGAEIVIHEHAKAWVESGHKVTLFTSRAKGLEKSEVIDGIEIIRQGNEVFGVQLRAFWYLFSKRKVFDLVIDNFHGIPFFTPLYVTTKKIAFIHEVAKDVWKLNPWPKPFNLIPTILGTLFEPLVFKLFYSQMRFITVSESSRKDLIKLGIASQNVKIILNGVSVIYPKSSKKSETTTVVFLGALTKDKGIEDAIDIFRGINDRASEKINFWVIGKGEDDYCKFLKQKIKDLRLENKIKLWGYVTEERKFELLGLSHIMINPSIREGWGLVVIEAAALGVPTIGYDVPGLRDSIRNGETGILCSFGDTSCVVANTLDLINDYKRYAQMSTSSLEWSKKFSWEKSTKESVKYIEGLFF